MQLAWSAIVIEAVCGIAVLLNLDQADARADSVHGIGGDIEEIAWLHWLPPQPMFDLSIQRSSAECGFVILPLESDAEARSRLGVEDQPAFLFPLTPHSHSFGLGV